MGNLQNKVEDVQIEVKTKIKPLAYKGLSLIEAVNYNGGTSIKYWM